MRSNLSKVFFIYSDATMASFLLWCGVVELICAALIPVQFLASLAFCAGLGFVVLSALLSLKVFRQAKADNII